jgi:hypothetical protein
VEQAVSDFLSKPCTAFVDTRCIASGALIDVALAVKEATARSPIATILTFDDATGAVVDLDLRGTTAEIIARLTERGRASARSSEPGRRPDSSEDRPARERGRPKLGVVAREVTLLPRHWEWLALQRGGASQALRRLVDEARRGDGGRSQARAAQETAYRFLSAIAGDFPGFEEASRALFAGDRERFAQQTAAWPADIRSYAEKLTWPGAAEHREGRSLNERPS